MTKKPVMWTLDQALVVIKSLQSFCWRLNYHVTLGGGVLNHGDSRKDLDLFFLPFGQTKIKPDTDGLRNLLSTLGQEFPLGGGFEDQANALNYVNQERTFAHRFTYRTSDSKRIDVFIAV